MALWSSKPNELIRRDIQIVGINTSNQKYTEYVVEIRLDDIRWQVNRRYSEFNDLHEQLVKLYTIDKNSLPPKKLFNNHSDLFVQKRRQQLDTYLKNLFLYFSTKSIPESLADFLHFQLYEVHGIVRKMAQELFLNGEKLLLSKQVYRITPLQLHAITKRVKLAEPPCDGTDPVKDISHVLEFLCHVKYVQIVGSPDYYGTSTIRTQTLPFDVSFLKSVEELELDYVQTNQISGIDNLKKNARKLSIHRSLAAIKEIALSSLGEIPPLSNEWLISTWKLITTLDFSKNSLRFLDESLKLFCKAESLDLSFNLLETTVEYLQHLHFLQNLNLSNNRLQDVADFYQRVGNIRSLDLSYNEIISTEGLSRLYSLITLNLNNNKLDSVKSIESLGSLPCLENLLLKNNPLTRIVDYRIRVFAVFRDRAKDVWLDGQMPDQREIDRAMVISAMTRAKQNEAAASTMHIRNPVGLTSPTTSKRPSIQISSSPYRHMLTSKPVNCRSEKSTSIQTISSCPSKMSNLSTTIINKIEKQFDRNENDQSLAAVSSTMTELDKEKENDLPPVEFTLRSNTVSSVNSAVTVEEEKNVLSQSKPDVLMDVITDHTGNIEQDILYKSTDSFNGDLPPNIFIDQITTTLLDLTNDT